MPKPPRSCHGGPYYFPSWMLRAEREAHQEEQQRQCDEDKENKVGINTSRDHHPLFNPSAEDLARQEQVLRESVERDRQRHLSNTQQEYYRKAVELIRTGTVKSYADLGQRFVHSYGREKGKPFGAKWAFYLVEKIVARNTITREEVEQLLPDRTSPFKRNQQSTNTQEN